MVHSPKRFAAAALLVLSLLSPLEAAAQSKDEVVDRMASLKITDYSGTQIFRKLVTFDLSPEIWTYISNTNASDGLQQISSFAPEMVEMAIKMGWGDLKTLTRRTSTAQEGNPLIDQMIDSWKGKMSLKLVCNFKPTGEPAMRKALSNLCAVAHPLEEERIKPKSGKMFLTVTASPTASSYSVKVSPDGTTFDIVVPVYADYSQDGLTNAFAKCAGSLH